MGNQNMTPVALPAVQLADNYTAIVTGGHAGMGYEVTKYLALMGARVIIACESEVHAKAAMLRMRADFLEMGQMARQLSQESQDTSDTASTSGSQSSTSHIDPTQRVEFIRLDLCSLESVVMFAHEFKAKDYPLHLLVNNAGVIQVPQGHTEDGYETHFQVNYLSHFLLTLYMLPLLRESDGDARVITVSSSAHTTGDLNLNNMQGKKDYSKSKFYANSRLYQIMATGALNRRLEKSNVSIFSLHPGSVEEAVKMNPVPIGWRAIYNATRKLGYVLSSLAQGVSMTLKLSLDPSVRDLSGSYFVGGIPVTPSTKAKDTKAQEVLWKYTIDCIKDHVTKDELKDLQMSLEEILDEKD